MTLKARLLLFFLPLVIIPCVLVFILDLSVFETMLQAPAAEPDLYILAGGMCLILVVSIGFVVTLSHFLSTPIKQFTEQAHQVAEGNFDTPMPDDYDNVTFEIQQLAEALSRMKIDLKQREAREKEQAAHAAVGKVAAHVAHDLAGPLSSMQAALKYFRDMRSEDVRTPDYVNLLELSTTRLKAVSKELLDLHKGEEPKKILFSLHKLLDELVGEYQANDDYAAVTFVKRYSSQAMSLHGDRAKIQRVFGNLVKNAIEAMDKVGRLTVTAREDDGYAVVQIEDDGSGMPPEILERVLLGGVSHGKKDGHGIGMKVVRDTVTEHGGTLDAKSEVGIGTTFTVRLPLPESIQVRDVAREEGIVERFELALLPNEPLLVVDDSFEMLEQWRLEMEQLGRTTLSCTCYEDFLEKGIGSRLTQTAVVDYHFENSEIKGTDVIQKLKEQGFQRLYLCTAEYWKSKIRQKAEALGVQICPKPLPKVVITNSPLPPGEGQACPERSRRSEGEFHARVTAPVSSAGTSSLEGVGPGPSILLIDDDPDIHMCWKAMQNILGVGILTMHKNLEEMIAAATNPAHFDLCVIDKNIEGSKFDGARTLEYLRQNGARTVILASGDGEDDIRKDPRFNSADGVLQNKVPMTPGELEPFLPCPKIRTNFVQKSGFLNT